MTPVDDIEYDVLQFWGPAPMSCLYTENIDNLTLLNQNTCPSTIDSYYTKFIKTTDKTLYLYVDIQDIGVYTQNDAPNFSQYMDESLLFQSYCLKLRFQKNIIVNMIIIVYKDFYGMNVKFYTLYGNDYQPKRQYNLEFLHELVPKIDERNIIRSVAVNDNGAQGYKLGMYNFFILMAIIIASLVFGIILCLSPDDKFQFPR